MFDWVLKEELEAIAWVQRAVPEGFGAAVAKAPQYFADADVLMAVAFPLLLVAHRQLAHRFALTIAFGDMMNAILKWVVRGHRPYWWVKISDYTDLPAIRQVSLTCETSAGSPSGHAMCASATGMMLLVIASRHHMPRVMQMLLWALYAGVLATVVIGRLYIAAHFPHQMILGIGAGAFCGWTVGHLPLDQLTKRHYYAAAFFFTGWAFLTFHFLGLFGIDPNATVQLALAHCQDRSWVHPASNPWHAVVRNGTLFLATGATARLVRQKKPKFSSVAAKVFSAILAYNLVNIIIEVQYPLSPIWLFYACTVVKNMMIVHATLWVAPLIIDMAAVFWARN